MITLSNDIDQRNRQRQFRALIDQGFSPASAEAVVSNPTSVKRLERERTRFLPCDSSRTPLPNITHSVAELRNSVKQFLGGDVTPLETDENVSGSEAGSQSVQTPKQGDAQ